VRHSAPSASQLRKQRRASRSRETPDSRSRETPASRLPRLRHLPYVIILIALVLTLAWIRQSGQNVRGGTLAVAGILFAAALARLALPERRAGMLASRRRLADVAVLAALGTGLLVAGLVLPAQA
jgi:hypothetical protein